MSSQRIEKLCVLGLGYIGLPTAAMFASKRLEVVGVDTNEAVVAAVARGDVHIAEPDLDALVRDVVQSGSLRTASSPEAAGAFLIAVPTPFKESDHDPDLSYVEAATKAIAPVLEPGNLVVLESTVPVGATERMAGWLADARPDLTFPQTTGCDSDIRIAHCPERVLPGRVIRELSTNDRIIGGMTPKCSELAVRLYDNISPGRSVVASGTRVAEMAKLTENSFRDVNIAFANELSLICDTQELDVWELISLANRHPRVDILQPGPGVGGHCIAVDPWFIIAASPQEARLIRTARDVNDEKPRWVVGTVHSTVQSFIMENPQLHIQDVSIACYGLAFKADVDDLRQSPALLVAEQIANEHPGKTVFVEPNLTPEAAGALFIGRLTELEVALETADIHVLLVDHRQFKGVRPSSDFIVDTRGIWGGASGSGIS